MASTPYCEQVGLYLQLAPNKGDSSHWYNLMIPKNNQENKSLMTFIVDLSYYFNKNLLYFLF